MYSTVVPRCVNASVFRVGKGTRRGKKSAEKVTTLRKYEKVKAQKLPLTGAKENRIWLPLRGVLQTILFNPYLHDTKKRADKRDDQLMITSRA